MDKPVKSNKEKRKESGTLNAGFCLFSLCIVPTCFDFPGNKGKRNSGGVESLHEFVFCVLDSECCSKAPHTWHC